MPSNLTTSGRWLIAIILLVAFGLRLIWVFAMHNPLVGDSPWFQLRAIEMIGGGGYSYDGTPTAFFPVGYPAILAMLYSLLGAEIIAAKLLNVIVGTLLCWLTFLLSDQLLNRRTSIVACLLMAIHPNQIFYSSLLIAEPLFAFLIICFLVLLIRSKEKPKRIFAAGIVLGVACLVRSVALIIPVVILGFWVFESDSGRSFLTKASFLLSGLIIVVAPWTTRNLYVMKHPILISTNGGVNFWMAQTSGGYRQPPLRFTTNWHRASTPEEEVRAERQAYAEAFSELKSHPYRPLLSFPNKMVRLYYSDIDGLLFNAGLPKIVSFADLIASAKALNLSIPDFGKVMLLICSQLFYLFILLSAVFGAYQSYRLQDHSIRLLMILLVFWTLLHCLFFFPLGRYRYPIMPILIMFAASSLSQLIGRFSPSINRILKNAILSEGRSR